MSINQSEIKAINILLVEDNPADVRLTLEALKDERLYNELIVAEDGAEALEILRQKGKYADQPLPDIILLDLNLPRKDGREVLKEIKTDDKLKRIPVVVLTSSEAEADIVRAYDYNANCYITKPVGWDQFKNIIKTIGDFWFTIVKLPSSEENDK
ncbi:MAG: response regulator [Firmicutes bacterium]|nr:response regulator [Bacillota bacterium]